MSHQKLVNEERPVYIICQENDDQLLNGNFNDENADPREVITMEFAAVLIDLVRPHEHIYNLRNANHADKLMIENSWAQISEILQTPGWWIVSCDSFLFLVCCLLVSSHQYSIRCQRNLPTANCRFAIIKCLFLHKLSEKVYFFNF